jgi:hypothetical protein
VYSCKEDSDSDVPSTEIWKIHQCENCKKTKGYKKELHCMFNDSMKTSSDLTLVNYIWKMLKYRF